jgi:peroxiredoxin
MLRLNSPFYEYRDYILTKIENMNKKTIITFLFSALASLPVFAQLPEKAEDISPLLIGEKIPTVTLISSDGSIQNLADLVTAKPTVLLIYRGGWCPYCNVHLSEIQKAESEVISLGYQILAISPDSPENLKQTIDKKEIQYSLFSDADGKLIKALGIAFKAPERYSGKLNMSSGGLNEGFLPVPSVFVVDSSGKILFEYVSPDYKTRIGSGLLVAVLKELKN